jgi:EAL domain-containing protein (putative c-di-GMP-specific phosphodiesterase class I)
VGVTTRTSKPAIDLEGNPLLEYQPAVDLATGRLLGFEAFVRWDHPTKGVIPPAVLLPWAEQSGGIAELDRWVIAEACKHAQGWPSGIQLAVNCSLEELMKGEASRTVAEALESSGLNPDRLTVEVTERTIANESAADDLRALIRLGVHLAVDDVGTSWSSLRPLKQFAVDTVKIDEAFITSLEATEGMNRAIVEAIVNVSHSLAMSTVAEGVESIHQVEVLRDFGADVAQGFFFAGPLPFEKAEALATADPRPVFSLGASFISSKSHLKGAPVGLTPAALAPVGLSPVGLTPVGPVAAAPAAQVARAAQEVSTLPGLAADQGAATYSGHAFDVESSADDVRTPRPFTVVSGGAGRAEEPAAPISISAQPKRTTSSKSAARGSAKGRQRGGSSRKDS